MISINKYLFIFGLGCILLFAINSNVFAQKESVIDIKQADNFYGEKIAGKEIRKLIGNVVIQHENTVLFCDSAYMYADNKNVDAFSDIRINVGDSVNIFGKLLHYNSVTKIADIHDSVIMVDGTTILTTDSLTYNIKQKTAFYQTGGEINDNKNNNRLTSVWGIYHSDKKQFYFRNHVVIVNPEYTLYSDTVEYNSRTGMAAFTGPTNIVGKENHIYSERGWYDTKNDLSLLKKNSYVENKIQKLSGDSLYYDKKNGMGKAYYNVVITDTVKKMIITGGYGEYNQKTGISLVIINAMLTQIGDNDSLYLHADTLKVIDDTIKKEKTVFAYFKAKFFKKDLQGMSDSLVYKLKDSSIYLYHNPILWSEDSQLSADSIKIFTYRSAIRSIYLYNSSFIVSLDDSLKYNQIKGKDMIGYFRNSELYKMNVYNNSESIYYVRDDKQALIGINKAESINMTIYFKKKKVDKIVFLVKPKATLYPEKELMPNDLILRNFKWEESRRPKTKEEIFIW